MIALDYEPTRADVLHADRNIKPYMVTVLVAEALDVVLADIEADGIDRDSPPQFLVRSVDDEVDINAIPAFNSLGSVFLYATWRLNCAVGLEPKLTEPQVNLLAGSITDASTPDNHYKNNFLTSYPLITLGYLHTAVSHGDLPRPETYNETLKLLDTLGLDRALWQGMYSASGVWAQTADSPPWAVFRNMPSSQDGSGIDPFEFGDDGMNLSQPNREYLHTEGAKLSEHHPLRVCPVAVRRIHTGSADSDPATHLTGDQIALLTAPRANGDPKAVELADGSIQITFDALSALHAFYKQFASTYVGEHGVPRLAVYRGWRHKSNIEVIGPDDVVESTVIASSKQNCPLNIRSRVVTARDACTCAL